MAVDKWLKIRVEGRVQGVFFRDSARRQAALLGINGFALNGADGSVYIEAQGKAEQIERFLQWCRCGPRWARVEGVSVEEVAVTEGAPGFSGFEIRFLRSRRRYLLRHQRFGS